MNGKAFSAVEGNNAAFANLNSGLIPTKSQWQNCPQQPNTRSNKSVRCGASSPGWQASSEARERFILRLASTTGNDSSLAPSRTCCARLDSCVIFFFPNHSQARRLDWGWQQNRMLKNASKETPSGRCRGDWTSFVASKLKIRWERLFLHFPIKGSKLKMHREANARMADWPCRLAMIAHFYSFPRQMLYKDVIVLPRFHRTALRHVFCSRNSWYLLTEFHPPKKEGKKSTKQHERVNHKIERQEWNHNE